MVLFFCAVWKEEGIICYGVVTDCGLTWGLLPRHVGECLMGIVGHVSVKTDALPAGAILLYS